MGTEALAGLFLQGLKELIVETNPRRDARKILRTALVALVAACLATGGLQATGAFQGVDSLTQRARFEFRGPRASTTKIVVVGVGPETLSAWDEFAVLWPPRVADVVRTAFEAEASWVGLDWIFERDADAFLRDRGWQRDPEFNLPLEAAALEYGGRLGIGKLGDRSSERLKWSQRIGQPWQKLDTLATLFGSGCFLELPAPVNGLTWQGFDTRGDPGALPSLASLATEFFPDAPPASNTDQVRLFGINFLGRPVPTFEAASLASVDPEALRGAIVLFGPLDPSFNDQVETPVGRMAGVEVHANALATLLDGAEVTEFSGLFLAATVLAAALAGAAAASVLGGLAALLVGLGLAATWAGIAQAAFNGSASMVPLPQPLFALALALATGVVLSARREANARRRIESLFGAAMSHEVRDKLVAGAGNPSADLVECTVVFLDMRGSTAMARKLTPTRTLDRINTMLALVVPPILEGGGVVNRFTGDGFLALFGAPVPLDDSEGRAVAACLRGLEAIDDYNLNNPNETIQVGFAANSGVALAGTIGPRERYEYTVIGDVVNMASRIETLNPELGTRFLIGQPTHEAVRGRFETRLHSAQSVKGGHSIEVYEVLGHGTAETAATHSPLLEKEHPAS